MHDGPKQVARDEVFRQYMDGEKLSGPFPSRWTCPEVQPWLYGYDAFQEVADAVKSSPFSEDKQVETELSAKWTPPVLGRVTSWIKTRMSRLSI